MSYPQHNASVKVGALRGHELAKQYVVPPSDWRENKRQTLECLGASVNKVSMILS